MSEWVYGVLRCRHTVSVYDGDGLSRDWRCARWLHLRGDHRA